MTLLILSAHSFILPAVYSIYTSEWTFATLCLNLYVSSIFWHGLHARWAYVWDQAAIMSVWTYGAYHNLQLPPLHAAQYWAITLYLWFIYFGGHCTKRYCFAPHPYGEYWHSTIHFISSVGLTVLRYLCS